ncbi:hypothetical protein DSO57_1034432 [Entomophthora muscae]|uniref:Uncharacterized protein n=1 Tax=Entomophthora muscae TaxID=34485 RepID=A0ACC2S1X0_9FUNG|nr:hypothetical protein DSO57_1034432 [Entomophthora muscae]
MQFLMEPRIDTPPTSSIKSGVLIHLLSNSTIDLKQRVFVTSNGRVDYFGDSPMAMLLTMYTLQHQSPEKLASLHLSRVPVVQPSFSAQPVVGGNGLAECVANYFRHFHPYFPVVHKAKFLKRLAEVPPVLVNMVCAIGAGYSPHLSTLRGWCTSQAVTQLRYAQCSVGTMTAMLLMANYQHAPGEFIHGWAYLGYAIRMAYALGLDRASPSMINRDDAEIRRRVWWCLHILDKLYAFSLNRPWTIDARITSPSLPRLINPDLVLDTPEERAESACSLAFTRHLAELCDLMCLMVRKFKFTEVHIATKESEFLAQATARHLDLWSNKVEAAYHKIAARYPNANTRLFTLNLRLIYYGTLVQLFQSVSPEHHLRCTHAANNAILLAASLGQEFNLHSITYKFYALSSAIMIQIRNCRSTDQTLAAASNANLQIGLHLLKAAIPFYPLAREFHRLASLLAQAELIPIHQNVSFLFSNFNMPILTQ